MNDAPEQAPAQEPPGYRSHPGFVKSRWENNAHYVAQFAGDRWYEGFDHALQGFTQACPRANIVQIKEKFGELRFYYDLPDDLGPDDMAPWFQGDRERLRRHLDLIVARTEGWCAAVDHLAKKQATN